MIASAIFAAQYRVLSCGLWSGFIIEVARMMHDAVGWKNAMADNKLILTVVIGLALPASAAEGLSEDSQREQQFSQCYLEAMQRKVPQGDYVQACMGAKAWTFKPQGKAGCGGSLAIFLPECYERMK